MRRGIDFGARPGLALSQFVAVNAKSKAPSIGPILAIVFLVVAMAVAREWVFWLASAAVGLLLGLLIPTHPQGTVERLDQQRRLVGLDRAVSPQKIAILEPAARRWEQIDNAMQSEAWKNQEDWRDRVMRVSSSEMSRLVNRVMRGRDSGDSLQRLKDLSTAVDAVSASMSAYERPEFDSTGATIGPGLPEVAELESLLAVLEEDLPN